MKTTKFVLIAAILSFALMSFTTNDPGPFGSDLNSGAVEISLQAAMQNAGLVKAMHLQIDRSFLQDDQAGLYIAYVKYNRRTYGISGSHAEWTRFFSSAIGNNDPPLM